MFFRTKDELAIEIVDKAQRNRLQFGWVGADAGYGKGPGFLLELHRRQLQFVVDVHSNFPVYLQEPQPRVLASFKSRVQQPKQWKTDEDSRRFAIVVFTKSSTTSEADRDRAIAEVTRTLYDFYYLTAQDK